MPPVAVTLCRLGPLPLGIEQRLHAGQFGRNAGVFHL